MLKYLIPVLAVCAWPAMAQEKMDPAAVAAFEDGMRPAMQSVMFTALRAREAGFPFTGAIVRPDPRDPEVFQVGFVCPPEFGPTACDEVATFFAAIGGNCVEDQVLGIFCEGPEPGPPTRP